MVEIIKCTVNGKPVEVAVDPRETLLNMLRDHLGLTSVKAGCEVGECGACTVIVDGEAITSCVHMASWVQGKSVITSEGLLSKDGGLSPLQQAFVDEAAVQCGFCTPGFIMSATEMVMSGKTYTRDEIRTNISGNLCRCTGYEHILNAIEKVVGKDKKEAK